MKIFRSQRLYAAVCFVAMSTIVAMSAPLANAATPAATPRIHQSDLPVTSGAFAVAISADGSTVAVGEAYATVNGQKNAGAVQVYRRTGTGWGDPTQLNLGTGAASNEMFSESSIALSAGGNTLVGAAPRRTVNGKAYAGAAEVFRFNGTEWSAPTQIDLGSRATENGAFGETVALSAAGNTALLGQSSWTVRGKLRAGRALVYHFTSGEWKLQAQLDLGARARKNDDLGSSVALSADGTAALTGVPQRSRTVQYSGKAAVFRFARGKWGPATQLSLGSAAGPHDAFGYSVDLNADGNVALIGAPGRGSSHSNAGAGEVFRFRNGSWGWPRQLSWSVTRDSLGQSVSLSADGRTALLGAPGRNVYAHRLAGTGMLFRYAGGTWSLPTRLNLGVDSATTNLLGSSVGLSGNGQTAILAAPLREVSGAGQYGTGEVFGMLSPNSVLVTVNASAPHGSVPNLTSLSPRNPAITYDPATESKYVKGKLTCRTNASALSPPSGNPYLISDCHGLSDRGHTIVYDYEHSTYEVN
jgi:hypothetical protein